MNELNVCPSTLAEGFKTYSPAALKLMFDGVQVSHVLSFNSPNNEEVEDGEYAKHVGRVSLSGVQPKAGLVVKDQQLVRPSIQDRSRYILKPAPTSYALLERKDCPANEHLSMQIASQVYHIETAPNALCFFKDGEAAYVTRRFDVAPDGSKYQQEDLASLAGLTRVNGGSDYKYSNLSYEECAELVRRYTTAAPVEILKFFRIVIFNYLILNDDAHLKNFSLVAYHPGDYRLSLAYDLLNTGIHLPTSIFALEKGLFKEGTPISDTTPIGRPLFWDFGKRLGFADKLLEKELAFFARTETKTWGLIEGSSLSPEAKASYLSTYKYRLSTLQ